MGRHLVLYDGVCGLCNGVVRFVLTRDRGEVFDFASLQSRTGRSWLQRFDHDPDALDTLVVVTDYGSDAAAARFKSEAALHIASALGLPWRSSALLRVIPRPIRDLLYDLVAATRYRVFGRHNTCPLPSPQERRRFIDV
jgi:predicted DCC family thiol-disulfide oxidoreductase YuxK